MLMTEQETAARLRCSPAKVKRLRLTGKLAYYKGRPVLIDERDVLAYLECIKCRHPSSAKQTTATSTPSGQRESEAAAKAWALKSVLLRNSASRIGS